MQEKGYVGTKFESIHVHTEIPDEVRIPGLVSWCKRFHELGLAPPYEGGSYGNLSFRINEGNSPFVITCAKSGLAEAAGKDDFAIVDRCELDWGRVYSRGLKVPSSESMVHYAIYAARADINAVFHGHCQAILDNASRLGIAQTSKEEPYGTKELVDRVLEVLEENDFVIMKNHGFLSLGRNMEEAGNRAFEIYNKCFK